MTDGLDLNATLLVEGERLDLLFVGEDAARILKALAVGEEKRKRQLRRAVRGYLDAHPHASANEVSRTLGGRRAEVLAAIRAAREAPESHSKLTSPERAGSRAGNHLAVAGGKGRKADRLARSNGAVKEVAE